MKPKLPLLALFAIALALPAACSNTQAGGGGADASQAGGGGATSSSSTRSDTGDAAADADRETDSGDGAVAPATLGVMTIEALHTTTTKDFLLINVHVPYTQDIPGTDTHIAYTDVDALAAYIGVDLDKKVVLYCYGNPMALSAGDALVARGYRGVSYLDGGMKGWVSAGYSLQ